MNKPILKAEVKATSEPIEVYKLQNGKYQDYKAMGENEPPSAPKSGKKQFDRDELLFAPSALSHPKN